MKSPIFALIDCNNFFASCERVFRPDLKNKPVAVLSNNDGCVIARSNEVKTLGVRMGAPYFKDKAIYDANNVTLFSANFSLYGDISRRVHEVLKGFSPWIQMYSIDESFLDISDLNIPDYTKWAQSVASEVMRQVGIPVSVGVAPSKTLAKAAADKAKKTPECNGGYSIVTDTTLNRGQTDEKRINLLTWMPLEDVWGIGWRFAPRLKALGLRSAYDLTLLTDDWILANMSIRGMRTISELRGESCIELAHTTADDPQKSLLVSRSFSQSVNSIQELEVAVAAFAARAALKLREKHQRTWKLTTFIASSKHAQRQHYASSETILEIPSNDSAVLIKTALKSLKKAYDGDYTYKRAGVVLYDLIPVKSSQQMSLLNPTPVATLEKSERLASAVDQINTRYGHRIVKQAIESSTDTRQRWISKKEHVSPSYTTRWDQIPSVRA